MRTLAYSTLYLQHPGQDLDPRGDVSEAYSQVIGAPRVKELLSIFPLPLTCFVHVSHTPSELRI